MEVVFAVSQCVSPKVLKNVLSDPDVAQCVAEEIFPLAKDAQVSLSRTLSLTIKVFL